MPNGMPSGRKPTAGERAQAEEIHEVGVVAEVRVVEHRLALEIAQAIDRAGGRQGEEVEPSFASPRRQRQLVWPSKRVDGAVLAPAG
jgi:hypothetical protein